MKRELAVTMPGSLKSVKVMTAPKTQPFAQPQTAQAAPRSATPKPPDAELIRAGQAKVQQACQALKHAADQLAAARIELLADAEEQLLDLAVGLAKKALMQEIEGGRHRIQLLLKEAILRVQGRQDVVVYLHPDDLAQCLTGAGEAPELGNVKLAPDAMVQRGQCLVETSQGAMVSSFHDRLDDLADAVRSPEQ